VLINVKLSVVTRMSSFVLSIFCRGFPCMTTYGCRLKSVPCWVLPFGFIFMMKLSPFFDLPFKLVGMGYLMLVLPLMALYSLFTGHSRKVYEGLASAEGCCAGMDSETDRYQECVNAQKGFSWGNGGDSGV